MLPGGKAALVVFADTIVLTSLAVGQSVEEVVSLKGTARNRFFGAGAVSSHEAVAVTTRSGALKLALVPHVLEDLQTDLATPAGETSVQTQRLRARLEQAVFFGDDAQNPLNFELGVDTEGDLALAAQQVSSDVLASSASRRSRRS